MDSPRVLNELEQLRQQRIAENEAYLQSLMEDPEFVEVMNIAESLKTTTKSKPKRKRKNDENESFTFSGVIPLEKRRSARLENKPPIFAYTDLPEEQTFARDRKSCSDLCDLEEIVYKPKKQRNAFSSRAAPRTILSVDDVTEKMLSNISYRVSEKVYSDAGTSCHQCRQKTLDQKSCCRNPNCIGVRGQFCGVCAMNRYGEDVKVALKDPNWHCFVCRGVCNCSFCRSKAGKVPTGILTPMALQRGFKSVKDFLESLKEDRYRSEELQLQNDKESVVGFSNSGKFVHFLSGQRQNVDSAVCDATCLDAGHESVLGFSASGNVYFADGSNSFLLQCDVCKHF